MSEKADLKNTSFISHSISVPFEAHDVFDFFIGNKISKYYSDLSRGHKYFRLRSGDRLEVGSVIDCEETAGNQSIKHEYHVSEILANERICYSSKPSLLKIKFPWKEIDSRSNTYVRYDFERDENSGTAVSLTIGIQFSTKFEQVFSSFFGGIVPWKKHCVEEMEGLKKVLMNVLS